MADNLKPAMHNLSLKELSRMEGLSGHAQNICRDYGMIDILSILDPPFG